MNRNQFNEGCLVNLTKQLLGENIIATISSAKRESAPEALYLLFFDKLKEKVRAMNPETLGSICEFGYTKDFSEPLYKSSGFIRMTGIEQVHPQPFKQNQSGREFLEEIAIATIASVAVDIARQSDYEDMRKQEQEEDWLYERGMREYIHRGANARQL